MRDINVAALRAIELQSDRSISQAPENQPAAPM